MKIPAILLFLLLWSTVSCNLDDRESGGGGQEIFAREYEIESSDGSETLPDGRHSRDLPRDSMCNDRDRAEEGSNVDKEVTVVGEARHGSGRNNRKGARQRLLRQKVAGSIGDEKRTKKKKSLPEVAWSTPVQGKNVDPDVAEAIGKVTPRHTSKKRMSPVSTEIVARVSNEKRQDMVKNGIVRVGKVTPPLNNVPLISGGKGGGDDVGVDRGTKNGPRSPKAAVAEIGKFETPPATGERKEDATKGGTTSKLVEPLSPIEATDCADESKKGPNVERFSTKDGQEESLIEHDENAVASRRGSRQKRSLHLGQTYNEHGTDPRLMHWPGLSTEFTTGRNGLFRRGATRNDPVTVSDSVDWSRFTLDDLFNGVKTTGQKSREPNTYRIFNWGDDGSEKDTNVQSWGGNRFPTRTYRFDRSGLDDTDTKYTFNNDYTPTRFRTYSWDVGKQGVERAEKENNWNFGVSHGENEENRFGHGSKWNTRLLYQPQTGRNVQQKSDIGTTKNKLSNQRSLYQFSTGSGSSEGKDRKKEGITNFNRFQSTLNSNKYRVTSLPTFETVTSGLLKGDNQKSKKTTNTNRFQSTASRSKLQVASLPTIGSTTPGWSGTQNQNNANTINTNRFQSAAGTQARGFRANNQKTERTASANHFGLTTARGKYQISGLPAIGTFTSERPQMKNQKYVGSANTDRFQSRAAANKYRVPQLPTINSSAEKSKTTSKRFRYNHLGGSYDLGFSGADFYAKPKIIDRDEFLRQRYSFQNTEHSSGSAKNSQKQEVATTAATKIETETNGNGGKQSSKKSAKVSKAAKSNSYDAFLKNRMSGKGTGRLYRYNQVGNSRDTAAEKKERHGVTGNSHEAWNAQSTTAQSDVATHNGISYTNAARKQGGAWKRGNSIASKATNAIRYDRSGSDVSKNARVSEYDSQTSGSKASQFSKHWQRPSTTKSSSKANTKQGGGNARKNFNFSSKKSKSGQRAEKKASSEENEFQFIPLVLTPMSTAPRRWTRGRSTIKNQRIYYNPDELFKMHDQQESAKEMTAEGEDQVSSKSKTKSQPRSSGAKFNSYERWRKKNIKNDQAAEKNSAPAQSDSSNADSSAEAYNKFQLILTAVPTSESYMPIRGVKNKRIPTDSVEGAQTDSYDLFGTTDTTEEEGDEKIRGTGDNYGSSGESSEVINYDKDSRDSSSVKSGKVREASAAGGEGSSEQSHEQSAELSESHAGATDKGSRVKDSRDSTIEKGTKQYDRQRGKDKGKESATSSADFETASKGGSASLEDKGTYNGIRHGELFEQRQFDRISPPSAAAVASGELPPSDIESSSGAAEGGAAYMNGRATAGSSRGPGSSALRSTSSTAGDETVERETSSDKTEKLSGRSDSVSADKLVRFGRIEDASAGSMARDWREEEWGHAGRIFAYRKFMAEGYGEAESRRLADRQLADKYTGAGEKLRNAAGVHGSSGNGETFEGGVEGLVYGGGSSAGGAGGLGRKSTLSAESGGKGSDDVSYNSNMTTKKENGGKTGSVGGSAKGSGEKMRVNNRMKGSLKNENSASTGAESELERNEAVVEWGGDKSVGKDLLGRESRAHGLNESEGKKRSHSINIASGRTSADASEKFEEENSEWFAGDYEKGWLRRGALGAHDKAAARAAESALSDKSRAESSAHGELASTENRGKSAKEISGVSVKSGASAGGGRYTGMLSDASLQDSRKVANGILREYDNSATEAESVSVANSHVGNSMEGVNERGHNSKLRLRSYERPPILSHGSDRGLKENLSLMTDTVSEVNEKDTADMTGGVKVDSVNNAVGKHSSLTGSSSGSMSNGWAQDENLTSGLASNKWSQKSRHTTGSVLNEKASLMSGERIGMREENRAGETNGASTENVNNVRDRESNLMASSSGPLTFGWSQSKNSKLQLTSSTWSPKSSHAFDSADVNADAESVSVNIKDLNTVKGSNLFDKSTSDLFMNNWKHENSRRNEWRVNQLQPTSSRTFGATKSNADAASTSNSGYVNVVRGKELGASGDSAALANARAESDTKKNSAPPSKLPSSVTFGTAKTGARDESDERGKYWGIDFVKSSSQTDTTATMHNRMQNYQSNLSLLKFSGANAEANASGKAELNESSEGYQSSQSLANAKSDAETLSVTDSRVSLIKSDNVQNVYRGQSKQTENKASDESSDMLEHGLGRRNDLTSAVPSNERLLKELSTSGNAKADAETISIDSAKSEIEIIAPTKGTTSSGTSHESLVSVKGDNEIHGTYLPAKQLPTSSSSPAASASYANGKLSGGRYKWESGAFKIPPPTETSASAASQGKTSPYGQLIGSKFSLGKSGINSGPPTANFAEHARSDWGASSNSAIEENESIRPESSSGSAVESISSSDVGRKMASFGKLQEASAPSAASADTQVKAADDAYSIGAAESRTSSETPGQVGGHGMDMQDADPRSSSFAFAASFGSRMKPAKLNDREVFHATSATSVASGNGLAGWSSSGYADGEAPQAKQSSLSAEKSHADQTSGHVGKLGWFNPKKLTHEFSAVPAGSSSGGPTGKFGIGAERSTAESLAWHEVTDKDHGRNGMSDKGESTSSVVFFEGEKRRKMEEMGLLGGYGGRTYRDRVVKSGNVWNKIGATRYADASEEGTEGSEIMKSFTLGQDALEGDETKIRRVHGKNPETDFAWASWKSGAKNIGGMEYGSGSEAKSSLFMKDSSGAISQPKMYEHGGSIKLSAATADTSSGSGLRLSQERMKIMNKGAKKGSSGSLETADYNVWTEADSKAKSSANVAYQSMTENRKQVHSNGASSSSSAKSSTSASSRGEVKGNIDENVSLSESQAKAVSHGSTGRDKLSGKKLAGKLIDASSEIVAGAGLQRHEFDGKEAGSVVSGMEWTRSIAHSQSMSSAEVDSSSVESGDKEGRQNKWAEGLSHSKVIEASSGESASRAVSGKLISADSSEGASKENSKGASTVGAVRKKWSPAESDTVSPVTRGLAGMRNKLPAIEDDLSSLSIVKNEGADVELINGKWSAASGGVLAKSRVDAVGVGKSSISSEAEESSESDSGALLRSMGGDKARGGEGIDELVDASAASAAGGKANSKITSEHLGQPRSGSSRLTSISKSGTLGGAEVYASGSDANAKGNASGRTPGYSSSESKASEALDMLTSSAESSGGLDKSTARSSARLVGPKSSSESWVSEKAESGRKGALSSTKDQSSNIFHPLTFHDDKSQKLTSKNADESSSVKSAGVEGSQNENSLHSKLYETGSHAMLSDISAKTRAEYYDRTTDVGRKLAGKWTVGSGLDSSVSGKSWSPAVQGAINMQAASESAHSPAHDVLSSDRAIDGKWRNEDWTDASSKSSAAIGGREASGGKSANVGNVARGSVGMNSEGKDKNVGGEWGGYELGEWADWAKTNEWREKRKWWMERLRKNLVSFSDERGIGVGGEKSDEEANEGLMFISYDSLGRETVGGENVRKGGQVGGSGGAGGESFVNLAEWTNGDFDRKKVRKEDISGLLWHESSDGIGQTEKSPHSAVIVPLTPTEWWSKEDGDQKNTGEDGKPSLFKFLGRRGKQLPEDTDESEDNGKFMNAKVTADSTEMKPDFKDSKKGKRIELIPVTPADSDDNSEQQDDVAAASKPEKENENTNKKKKCVKFYTLPSDNTPSSKKLEEMSFVRGISYEFEPDTSSTNEDNDKHVDGSDEVKKAMNPKKPYKICLDLDNSDNSDDEDKPRTEIFVVRWTSQGPVKVEKIEDKAKPTIIFKLLSRNIYEKIRNLLAHA